KEIAYVHAEGYPMGESKHGPIALVEDGFPVIVVDHGDEKERIEYGVMEMASRGAEIVVVSPREIKGESLIKTPEVSPILSPVIQVVPLQLFAYYSAVERGLNPDRPRNLAKSVTVL
ncbi:glutamine--fructose-6-phosphate aminotransferase, partial [Thermococci archaeon]